MKEYYQQAHENLRSIERHAMRAREQLNLFAEYQNEITRDNLLHTLEIAQILTKWIIDNTPEVKRRSGNK